MLDIAKVPRPLPLYHSKHDAQVRLLDPDWRPGPCIGVTATWADGPVTYARIGVTTTKPHFGGVRYWLVCPDCNRRVGKLYATAHDRRYLCRLCRDLVYPTQYEKHPLLVLWRRMDKWVKASPAPGQVRPRCNAPCWFRRRY